MLMHMRQANVSLLSHTQTLTDTGLLYIFLVVGETGAHGGNLCKKMPIKKDIIQPEN